MTEMINARTTSTTSTPAIMTLSTPQRWNHGETFPHSHTENAAVAHLLGFDEKIVKQDVVERINRRAHERVEMATMN
jgi:hypothetical protein